jgi:hypothetical protein
MDSSTVMACTTTLASDQGAGQRVMNLPERGTELLVCVYYRVAGGDSDRVISAVREFQRTLPDGVDAADPQVLLRCDLPPAVRPSDALPAPSPPASPSPPVDNDAAHPADATVMETYRLVLPAPAGTAPADAAVRAFLGTLEAAARPLAALLHGPRHVELFSPCVS